MASRYLPVYTRDRSRANNSGVGCAGAVETALGDKTRTRPDAVSGQHELSGAHDGSLQQITEFSTDVSAGTFASSHKTTMHIEIINCFTVSFLSSLRNLEYTILTLIPLVNNPGGYLLEITVTQKLWTESKNNQYPIDN